MSAASRLVPSDDDIQLVEAILRELRDYSNLAAAEALGISEATIRRWRAGSIAVPLRTPTRLALRGFLGARGWARNPDRFREPTSSGHENGPEAGDGLQVFASIAHIRDYIAELAPPGDAVPRKMDVLMGIRSVITARTSVPDWWYHLHDAVRRGEL